MGFVEFKVSDKFAVQPELLYSMQGAKYEGGNINLNDKNHLSIFKQVVDTCKSIIRMDLQDKEDAGIQPLISEIDKLIYKLYDLNHEEVKIIDSEFWMSAEEYMQYKIGQHV